MVGVALTTVRVLLVESLGRGSADIWWVGNGSYGQCSPDAALDATAPVEYQPVGNADFPLPDPAPADQESSVDIWLTGPLTEKTRRCIENGPDTTITQQCIESDPEVSVVETADATFGFTAFVHSAPLVVEDPFGQGFEALANVGGVEYQFHTGIASAPGATELATYLEPSDHPRLILLALKHGREGASLLVDGEPATFPTDLGPGSPWSYGREQYVERALLPPGAHTLTVDLRQGVQAMVLVYEAESQE
ncbi:hypothetical protein ISU10_22255 [Nocardioides agariphilus]|jgi:hypothetical protein|uniref:Uncharacterized protein n=1 Tax=Nocardioides agariphilus TaxID=433664 RepID=A0A930YRC9_9ACTN|nr:hypothetical protein [Nocardioides agariphilus]MBF4770505.1 hypothetical protein [Nocardioides agariphilus]